MNTVEPIRDKDKLEHMKFLLKLRSDRDYLLFVLGMNTGLRISDILPLRVKDVKDKTHLQIKIQKNTKGKDKAKKTTKKKINAILRQAIDDYIEDKHEEDFLFPSRKGDQPISRVQAWRILQAAAKKSGIEEGTGTHSLRKSFGYHVYKETKNLALVMQFLDHNNPSYTMRYIGISQDEQDEFMDNFSL